MFLCQSSKNSGYFGSGRCTSKKLRRHIGLGLFVHLSVCASVRFACKRSRNVRDRILKFDMWDEYEN